MSNGIEKPFVSLQIETLMIWDSLFFPSLCVRDNTELCLTDQDKHGTWVDHVRPWGSSSLHVLPKSPVYHINLSKHILPWTSGWVRHRLSTGARNRAVFMSHILNGNKETRKGMCPRTEEWKHQLAILWTRIQGRTPSWSGQNPPSKHRLSLEVKADAGPSLF